VSPKLGWVDMAVSIKTEEFSALVVASAWTAHSLKPVFKALLETSPRWGAGWVFRGYHEVEPEKNQHGLAAR
jgi:hypothetical protein